MRLFPTIASTTIEGEGLTYSARVVFTTRLQFVSFAFDRRDRQPEKVLA